MVSAALLFRDYIGNGNVDNSDDHDIINYTMCLNICWNVMGFDQHFSSHKNIFK